MNNLEIDRLWAKVDSYVKKQVSKVFSRHKVHATSDSGYVVVEVTDQLGELSRTEEMPVIKRGAIRPGDHVLVVRYNDRPVVIGAIARGPDDIGDQADLVAELESKVTLNGLEWTIVTGSISNLQDAVSALEEAVDDLEAGSGSSVWGSITGTLSDQTDLQNALDGKVGLSSLDWTVVTTSLANAQDDIADLQSGKADVGHTHSASDVTSGTFHVDRIPMLAIAKITGLQSALDGKADDLDITLLSSAVSDLQTNKADATHTHAGSDITSGTVAPARLGTGTPSGSTFLRGDGQWSTIPGGLDAEAVRDIIGTALQEGANIDIAVDDGNDTITIAVTGLAIGDVAGLQSALDAKATVSNLNLVSAALLTAQNDIDALETGKADASHTHNASDINAGTMADARIPNLNASKITAGTFAPARLGTGTPSGSNFLRGDGQWASVPGGLDAEAVRDIIGAALVEGANIDITVDDGADTITIAVTGLDISDISGLQAALDGKADDLDVTLLSSAVSDLQTNKADASHTHVVGDISATGTPSGTTYLRGDGQWATPPNTTYSSMSEAEMQAGTATTSRAITAQRLKQAVGYHPPAAHQHAGSDITSGTIAPARLGSGTPSSSNFLRGDGTWATPSASTTWGSITGTLSNQTDLQAALDGKADDLDVTLLSAAISDLQTNKANVSHTHSAADITSGTLADARIPNLNASKITAGTFADARIPNLAASKITSGTFNEARIPSLPISRITNLQSTLDGKVDTSWHQFRSLSSSFTTTSSSMQTVTGLNLAVPANSKWQLTYALPIGCSGAGGMDIGVIAPSGSDMTAMLVASEGAQGSSAMVPAMVISPGAFGVAIGKSAYTFGIASGVATITAIVEVGGTSGNISLQVRSITSGQTSAVAATDARLAAIQIV